MTHFQIDYVTASKYCDFTIQVTYKNDIMSIPCHKIILASKIMFFDTMFSSECREAKTRIMDINLSSEYDDDFAIIAYTMFKKIILSLYMPSGLNTFNSAETFSHEQLRVSALLAHQYDLTEVFNIIVQKFITETTTGINYIETWRTLKLLNPKKLSQFYSTIQSIGFLSLDEDLQELDMDEFIDLWSNITSQFSKANAIDAWIKYDPEKRQALCWHLLQTICCTKQNHRSARNQNPIIPGIRGLLGPCGLPSGTLCQDIELV